MEMPSWFECRLFRGYELVGSAFDDFDAVEREEDAVGGLVEGAVWEICRVVLF